ncbi:MAG: PEP-CTERM sorting domain-containing protein [Planctomycetota bacterium]
MKTNRLLSALVGATVLGASASASVIATETFTYPDGDLVGNGGWVNQSGTDGTLDVLSGQAVVTQDGGSEDTELVFASDLDNGLLTAAFDIVVTAPSAMTGTDFEYFIHFSDDTTFSFVGRVDVQTPNGSDAGDDYSLGIATFSSTGEAKLPVDFTFGDTVAVELAFDFETGLASLSAGGSTVFSTTVDDDAILDSINLRQSSSSSDETIFVDNIVISYVAIPEPASLGLLAMGGLLIAGRRRRKV